MRVKGPLVGEAAVGMFGQPVDHLSGQGAFAHIGERRGIDDVIAMSGAQQAEEVEAALRSGGAEPAEMVVADLGADAVRRLVAGGGGVHRGPRRRWSARAA